MGSVGTPILEGPRPSTRQRRTQNAYTQLRRAGFPGRRTDRSAGVTKRSGAWFATTPGLKGLAGWIAMTGGELGRSLAGRAEDYVERLRRSLPEWLSSQKQTLNLPGPAAVSSGERFPDLKEGS